MGGDSQSLLEQEPLRSKDRGLLSYNIVVENVCHNGHNTKLSTLYVTGLCRYAGKPDVPEALAQVFRTIRQGHLPRLLARGRDSRQRRDTSKSLEDTLLPTNK